MFAPAGGVIGSVSCDDCGVAHVTMLLVPISERLFGFAVSIKVVCRSLTWAERTDALWEQFKYTLRQGWYLIVWGVGGGWEATCPPSQFVGRCHISRKKLCMKPEKEHGKCGSFSIHSAKNLYYYNSSPVRKICP